MSKGYPQSAVNRRVNKAKEVIYSSGDVKAVLSAPSASRKLYIVSQRKEDDPLIQRLISKAKARDGVAGHQMFANHTFHELEDGLVQIREVVVTEETVA